MYAQVNYQQKVGNSGLSLAEAGCYVVSYTNLLEKVGTHVDPPTLNTFFTDHKVYTYDKTDKANDDLYWNSITKYRPQLVVAQIGGAGFPNLDLAIVEFHYKNHLGQDITHFCAVNHAADHSIIDSWDGKVKTPAEYEHVYGQPIAWATYVFHTVQTTPASLPPAAPVSAPKAAAPAPQPPAPAAPKQIVLPKTDHYYVWHTYNVGGPYTLPHAIHVLDPYHYGPLTYDILGNPAPNIYLIKTQNFGEVAIYAGPDTVAQFPGTGHGEGENTDNPVPDVGVPISETVPAPVNAPAIVYTRFPEPMQLVTKPAAHAINFESGSIVKDFDPDTPFEAVGKATFPDNVTYYMDDNSFGIADQTQRTPIMVGVKTDELSPAPAISTATTTPSSPIITSSTLSTPADAAQTTPINSAVSWQETFEPIIKGDSKDHPQSVDYTVINDIDVYDFATGNDEKHVKAETPVPVVGTFIFNGHRYYLAASSFKLHTWYGFPVTYPAPSLVKKTAKNTPFNNGDDINQLDHELETITKTKHAVLKAGGMADGFLARFKKQRSN